jgi:hypothetical protein
MTGMGWHLRASDGAGTDSGSGSHVVLMEKTTAPPSDATDPVAALGKVPSLVLSQGLPLGQGGDIDPMAW